MAATRLGCTEKWLGNKVRAREFPAHKVGRRWMFSESDLEEILDICAVRPHPRLSDPVVSPVTRTTARRLQTN
ncbi:helix-turn-helix domain-containing protein [Mycobacterium colombiense]